MLRRVVEAFQDRVDLPIEVEEIRDLVVTLGIQDKIIFSPEDLDSGVLRGAFYQWRESSGVYSDSTWTTLIVYPENEPIEWQRVICAKELIHLFDAEPVKTKTGEMVDQLARKIVGPFETRATSPSDLMASVDKLAQYQSFNLLFPLAARKIAREKLSRSEATYEDIATWSVLPLEVVMLVLDDHWDKLSEVLVAIGNGELAGSKN